MNAPLAPERSLSSLAKSEARRPLGSGRPRSRSEVQCLRLGPLLADGASRAFLGLRIAGGAADIGAIEREVDRMRRVVLLCKSLGAPAEAPTLVERLRQGLANGEWTRIE